VELRTLPLETGSRESIHLSAGVPQATGTSVMKAMPPRSAALSNGHRRPFQEHGTPVLREECPDRFSLSGAYVRRTHHTTTARQ
jgi:hypothetical protein